jgi:hypothetical protein
MNQQHKNDDWFYELRPYFIMAIGIFGILGKSFYGPSQVVNLIGFFSCITLLGMGYLVISMRKEYRRSVMANLRAKRKATIKTRYSIQD